MNNDSMQSSMIELPGWFKQIKIIQDRIDDERDGMSGGRIDPHPTDSNNYIINKDIKTTAEKN